MKLRELKSPILAEPTGSLQSFLAQNRWFFIGFSLLIIMALVQIFAQQVGHLVFFLNQQRSPPLDHFFVFVTRLAEPLAYILCALLLAMFRFRSGIFTFFIAIAVALVAFPLKFLFNQPRPLAWFCEYDADKWDLLSQFDPSIYLTSWSYTSFPSGHAMSAFALYSFVAFNTKSWKLPIALTCLLLAAGVGLSRIYLLMHFLRDVALGGSLGVIIGAALFFLQFKLWPEKKYFDQGWLTHFYGVNKNRSKRLIK